MFEIFRYKIDTSNINTLTQLKTELIQQRKIHIKYKNIIFDMNEKELKNFVFTGIYTEKKFEGIGILFIYCKNKDLKGIIKYIITLKKFEALNILRLFLYCLKNKDHYSGKFLIYLKSFEAEYGRRFNALLFDLGQQYYIDKLDLIELFKNLLL